MKIIPRRENETIVEEVVYDGDGELESKILINEKSNTEVETETFDAENKKIEQGIITRKDGRAIKVVRTTLEDGKESGTTTMLLDYDKNGNPISQKRTDENGEVDVNAKYEYTEFDKKGNWTKKLTYENSKEPTNISIREIEYYE